MSRSRRQKRSQRHLILFTVSLAAALICYYFAPAKGGQLGRLSLASAYVSLLLLGSTLSIGPYLTLSGRTHPVSSYLRRDLAIWAGVWGLVHTGLGLQVHMNGNIWLYFFSPSAQPPGSLRYDAFGLANHSGLLAALLLLLLLALSNNASLRRLGTQRWKRLQRCSYALAALLLVHGILYQLIEKRAVPLVVVFTLVAVAVSAAQLAGFLRRRSAARSATASRCRS